MEVISEWYKFKNVLQRYSHLFPERLIDKELFYNVYA